jgi:hypothetical protein
MHQQKQSRIKPMITKKAAFAKRKISNPSDLSKNELVLVDAIVREIQANNFANLDMVSWNEARENLDRRGRFPLDAKIRPELRKSLAKAVKALQTVPAPTLKNLLQLWYAATAYRASFKAK